MLKEMRVMRKKLLCIVVLTVSGCSHSVPPVPSSPPSPPISYVSATPAIRVDTPVAKTEVGPEGVKVDTEAARVEVSPTSLCVQSDTAEVKVAQDSVDIESEGAQVKLSPGSLKIKTDAAKVDLQSGSLNVDLGVDLSNVPGVGAPVDIPPVDVNAYLKDFQILTLPEIQVPGVVIRRGQGRMIYALAGDVLFDFDSADVRGDAAQALTQVAQSLQQRHPEAPIMIEGHSDSKGADAYNEMLSLRRARSVQQWLQKMHLLSNCRLEVAGRGKVRPVAPNQNRDGSDNPQGRQQNRRVELSVAE